MMHLHGLQSSLPQSKKAKTFIAQVVRMVSWALVCHKCKTPVTDPLICDPGQGKVEWNFSSTNKRQQKSLWDGTSYDKLPRAGTPGQITNFCSHSETATRCVPVYSSSRWQRPQRMSHWSQCKLWRHTTIQKGQVMERHKENLERRWINKKQEYVTRFTRVAKPEEPVPQYVILLIQI